jgi:flagellar basal body-associated protein FliL
MVLSIAEGHVAAGNNAGCAAVSSVEMFCNQNTDDVNDFTGRDMAEYKVAQAECYPELKRAKDWQACILDKRDLDRAYSETHLGRFNWAAYDQVRMHLVMDCGLCLAEQATTYVAPLPVPTYLQTPADSSKRWGTCSGSDIIQYCLGETWMAKLYSKSEGFKQAEKHCYPTLLQNGLPNVKECRIDEANLQQVLTDSTTAEEANGAAKGSIFANSKMEMLRTCDQCLGEHVKGYSQLLQAEFLEMFAQKRHERLRKPEHKKETHAEIEKALASQKMEVELMQMQKENLDDLTAPIPIGKPNPVKNAGISLLVWFGVVFAAACVFALQYMPSSPTQPNYESVQNKRDVLPMEEFDELESPMRRRRSSAGAF